MIDLQTALQWVLVAVIIVLVILGLIIGYKKLQATEKTRLIITPINEQDCDRIEKILHQSFIYYIKEKD